MGRSETGLLTFGEVRARSGESRGGHGQDRAPSGKSKTCLGTLREVRAE